jgi:hypothetical protein
MKNSIADTLNRIATSLEQINRAVDRMAEQAAQEKLLTLQDAATRMSTTVDALEKRIKRGTLKCVHKGHRKYIQESEILRDSPRVQP